MRLQTGGRRISKPDLSGLDIYFCPQPLNPLLSASKMSSLSLNPCPSARWETTVVVSRTAELPASFFYNITVSSFLCQQQSLELMWQQ